VARREIVVLEDDLEGGDAVETVKFAIDGSFYEIDLNSKNAKKLRDSLTRYVAAGRKVGRQAPTAARTPRGRVGAAGDREQNRAIREWAKKAGRKVSERGRIPQEIVEEYHAKAGRRG
jgi:Lsr2